MLRLDQQAYPYLDPCHTSSLLPLLCVTSPVTSNTKLALEQPTPTVSLIMKGWPEPVDADTPYLPVPECRFVVIHFSLPVLASNAITEYQQRVKR